MISIKQDIELLYQKIIENLFRYVLKLVLQLLFFTAEHHKVSALFFYLYTPSAAGTIAGREVFVESHLLLGKRIFDPRFTGMLPKETT